RPRPTPVPGCGHSGHRWTTPAAGPVRVRAPARAAKPRGHPVRVGSLTMCGIAGEVRFDGNPIDLDAVARMSDVLRPRGPDGDGIWQNGRIALAHRRLSIIDLSAAGAQPMTDPALRLATVFNGCIYNYRELREELQSAGYAFFSTSDTEVVGKAYHRWGTNCVDHFKGMFAFAVTELDSGRVVLARDRLGIKPLYLAQTRGRLRFASSLPALVAAGDVD